MLAETPRKSRVFTVLCQASRQTSRHCYIQFLRTDGAVDQYPERRGDAVVFPGHRHCSDSPQGSPQGSCPRDDKVSSSAHRMAPAVIRNQVGRKGRGHQVRRFHGSARPSDRFGLASREPGSRRGMPFATIIAPQPRPIPRKLMNLCGRNQAGDLCPN